MEGYNGRLDAIQAGILRAKLKHLPEWTEMRRKAAERYRDLFARSGTDLAPFEPESSKAVYHLYVIRVRDREGLIRHLTNERIGSGIHYPVPLHLQEAYRDLGYAAGDLPVSEKIASELVSLPMFPQLTAEQQVRVVESVARFISDQESKLPSLNAA
jgi:dTDP-4-amino-4,6-dideoxygalactose transaminase